jgi:hypothetical protein
MKHENSHAKVLERQHVNRGKLEGALAVLKSKFRGASLRGHARKALRT